MFGPEFNSWIESLKPGDTVGVVLGPYGREYIEAPVQRLTKTLVIVGIPRLVDGTVYPRQFRKRDGFVPGESFSRDHIVKPTQFWRDRQENRELREKITEKYSRTRFSELKLVTLRRVLDVLIECETELKDKARDN